MPATDTQDRKPRAPARTIARLEQRLARQFDLVTEPIPVGPLRVQFTRVADPERVLDELCERIDAQERLTGQRISGDEMGLPYWAELWDSAIGVGQWLIKDRDARGLAHPEETRPPLRVLDLGCGMGLAGAVAAMLGAEVLMADIERPCLLFAQLNGLRYNPTVRARRVDWQRDDLGERFDLIIGSDVLYDKTQWVFLDPFFRKHLADGGRVILGEPGRQTGDLFLPWIEQRGWTLVRHIERVPTRTVPVRLFQLRSETT
jgi:predicted nicotinamide N-methyase